MKTRNLKLYPFLVVTSIVYDEQKGKATGVKVVDTESGEKFEYYAKTIFVNDATLSSNLLLLNSTSNRFPNGLGSDSETLGKYVAFINSAVADYQRLKVLKTVIATVEDPQRHLYLRLEISGNKRLTSYGVIWWRFQLPVE
jgi:hypothetical protein